MVEHEKNRIAVLIDAENISYNMIDSLFDKVNALNGQVVYKKAFGNWTKEGLKEIEWQDILQRYAIVPEQIFDFTKQKNAADIRLVIYALKIMYTTDIDTFVIVTSDSDFTPLVYTLRENNKTILGFGSQSHSESFKNACDKFEILEITKQDKGIRKKKVYQNKNNSTQKQKSRSNKKITAMDIWEIGQDKLTDNGWMHFDAANVVGKSLCDNFNVKKTGFKSFKEFIKSDKRFEIYSENKDTHYDYFFRLKALNNKN